VAVTVSGLFVANYIDILDPSQLAIDLTSASNKLALFSNTITPNFSTDTAYAVAPYNANEVTGTNWAAGGVTMASQTVSESPTGSVMYDAADISVSSATFTGARCALIFANALTPKSGIVLVNFGADFSPNNGTFTIQWATGGIYAIDITP
jgi:hypothetical protein